MNFGIYIDSINDQKIAAPAFNLLNKSVEEKHYKDNSLFYNDIGPMPMPIKCGMFNSTDLQFFRGDLLVTFIEGVKLINNLCNDHNVYYLYGLESQVNLFDLLSLKDVKILASSDEAQKFLLNKLPSNSFPICRNFTEAYYNIVRTS